MIHKFMYANFPRYCLKIFICANLLASSMHGKLLEINLFNYFFVSRAHIQCSVWKTSTNNFIASNRAPEHPSMCLEYCQHLVCGWQNMKRYLYNYNIIRKPRAPKPHRLFFFEQNYFSLSVFSLTLLAIPKFLPPLSSLRKNYSATSSLSLLRRRSSFLRRRRSPHTIEHQVFR